MCLSRHVVQYHNPYVTFNRPLKLPHRTMLSRFLKILSAVTNSATHYNPHMSHWSILKRRKAVVRPTVRIFLSHVVGQAIEADAGEKGLAKWYFGKVYYQEGAWLDSYRPQLVSSLSPLSEFRYRRNSGFVNCFPIEELELRQKHVMNLHSI